MASAPISLQTNDLRSKPPPLWFVTNGELTVGPVTTNLLVRGVLHERIPSDCLVRERAWFSWRKLDRIREVAALRQAQSRNEVVKIERARWKDVMAAPRRLEGLDDALLRAGDPEDVFQVCLTEAMRASGALVGAVHRRARARSGFVTVHAAGPGTRRLMGLSLPGDDPAFALAHEGRTLCEAPRVATASDCVGSRLGALPSCGGVAMVPIVCGGRLYAVIELGRPDHEFRRADFRTLVTVSERVADRLSMVRNCASALVS
jgi:hypothetical protein